MLWVSDVLFVLSVWAAREAPTNRAANIGCEFFVLGGVAAMGWICMAADAVTITTLWLVALKIMVVASVIALAFLIFGAALKAAEWRQQN